MEKTLKGMYTLAENTALALTVILVVLITVLLVVVKIKKPAWFKYIANIITGVIMGYSITIVTIMMSLYIYKNKGEGIFANNIEWSIVGTLSKGQKVQLYIYPIIIVAIVLVLAFVVGKKHKEADKTRAIVYGAICIAMSFALSYIRMFELPQGGSITFASLIPVMIYSYIFGMRKGVLIGFIYGILQFFQGPWFYHPVQFFLDYPIAFMSIGLAGLFKEANAFKKDFKSKQYVEFALGALVVLIIRYMSHVTSGIFVFGTGDEKYSNVAWSFLYNSFAIADMAIALVAAAALFASKSFVSMINSADIQGKVEKTIVATESEEETTVKTVILEDDEK